MRDLPGAGLVFAGGAIGTLARFLLDGVIQTAAEGALVARFGIPYGILVINIAGAFLLGLLSEGLEARPGGRSRAARLFLGTGVLGGFTTYSALAAGVAGLALYGGAWLAALYGALTLLLGGCASWLGIVAARTMLPVRSAP